VVTGPITCQEGLQFTLDVTLTQRTSGVIGQGQAEGICTGETQQYVATAVLLDRSSAQRQALASGLDSPFIGVAKACIAARFLIPAPEGPEAVDAKQWCRDEVVIVPPDFPTE
jgi:hypothetical protein